MLLAITLRGAAGIETMPITAGIGRARVIEIHDPDVDPNF